jgi:hypothetical protein
MNPSQILGGLVVAGNWSLLLIGGALGAAGAAIHFITSGDARPTSATWWKSALVGAVAALGVLYAVDVSTAEKFVGLELLAGFFAQSLLASLESRLQLAVAQEKREQAKSVAVDAIKLAESRRSPAATSLPGLAPGADMEMSALTARVKNL